MSVDPSRRSLLLLAIACLTFGCNAAPPSSIATNKPKARTEAASLMAKTAHVAEASPAPAPIPAPARSEVPAAGETKAATGETPRPIDETPVLSQETNAEAETPMLVEYRPPAIAAAGGKSGGMFEGSITGAIETNVEKAMQKGNITWAEVQKSARVQRAVNAAAEAFAKVMNEPDARPSPTPPIRRDEGAVSKPDPPFVRCVVLSMDNCPGCRMTKKAIRELKAKGYTCGAKPTDDFQVYEWSDNGAEGLRRKYSTHSYPTQLLLKEDGTEVARAIGGLTADQLKEWLDVSRENVANW